MESSDNTMLKEVSRRIEGIERLAREMVTLGGTVPAIAKNARILLATTYVMKFGISDLVEINEPDEGAS